MTTRLPSPLRYRALIPAVGWSVVSWYQTDAPSAEIEWVPVVVWAIKAGSEELEIDDEVIPLVPGDDGATDLWPVSATFALGLYPTARQDDPALAAELLALARDAYADRLRRRAARAPADTARTS